MSTLAFRYGLKGWADIHQDGANAELKKKRPNPNVLAPGDEVVVPAPASLKKVTVATEEKHRFILTVPSVKIRVAFHDRTGQPHAGKRYVLNVGDKEVEGKTNDKGVVEESVRVTATTARLRVWLLDDPDLPPSIDRELAIGHLDPVDTIGGVQARLSHLGYRCPRSGTLIHGHVSDPTLLAVQAFRASQSLPAIEPPTKAETSHDDDETSHDDDETSHDEGPTAAEVAEYAERLMDQAFRDKLLALYESGQG